MVTKQMQSRAKVLAAASLLFEIYLKKTIYFHRTLFFLTLSLAATGGAASFSF